MIISQKNQVASFFILCISFFTISPIESYYSHGTSYTQTYVVSMSPTWHAQQQSTDSNSVSYQNNTLETIFDNHRPYTSMPCDADVQRPAISQQTNPKPVHDIRAPFIALQKQGDVARLQELKHTLEQEKKKTWLPRNRRIIQKKIECIDAILKSPLTKQLEIIRTGTIDEALAALHEIERECGYDEDAPPIMEPTAAKLVAEFRNRAGFDCVEAAQSIFRNRSDYYEYRTHQAIAQKQKNQHSLSTPCITFQNYRLDVQTSQLLDQQGFNPADFETFSGNPLQQKIHQQYVNLLHEATELHKHHNESVQHLSEAAISFINIGRQCNEKGYDPEALFMAEYSTATLYIAKDIAIGACKGITNVAQGICYAVMHPKAAIYGLANGIATAGEVLFYIAADLGELDMLGETDRQAAVAKAHQIRDTYKPICKAIKQKVSTMTLRDWSSAVTQGAIESYLQVKLLQTTGKLLKGIGKSAIHLVEKNPFAVAEQVAVTADGQLLRVAGEAGESTILRGLGSNKATNPSLKNIAPKGVDLNSIVKQTHEQATEILKKIEKPLEALSLNGNLIKNIAKEVCKIHHIFSIDHAKAGIFNICPTTEELLIECIGFIKTADSKGLLLNGNNYIRTHINGIAIEIRPFIRDGTLLNINIFVGHSNRKVLNLIKL